MDIEHLRRRLLLSVAATLAACGPPLPGNDEGGGGGSGGMEGSEGTTNGGATSGGGPPTPPVTTTTTADPDDGGSDDSVKYDLSPVSFDIGGVPPVDCEPQPMPPIEECTVPFPEELWGAYFQFYCVTPLDGQTCDDWAMGFDESQAEMLSACLEPETCAAPLLIEIGCGPLPDFGDQCCFWFISSYLPLCPGRPFVVDGRERLAELVGRDDWAEAGAGVDEGGMSEEARAAIAAAWAEQARFEHASIASFARFVLQLLGCGAPARLVAAAQVALGEEIEHARLFFGFASRYAGRAVGPGALATEGALAGGDDLDAVVLATVREGCIAETISAWHVSIAAGSASDRAMSDALARVAEQELRHAELAWSFVAWALPRASASLRGAVAATLREAARSAPRGPTLASGIDDAQWLAHGILPARLHAEAAEHALRELVAPVGRSLLRASVGVHSSSNSSATTSSISSNGSALTTSVGPTSSTT